MEAAERRWFQLHPNVLSFQKATAEAVRRDHFYESPLGGKRYIAAPWGSELDREVKNIPCQMGAASLMNAAQIKLHALGAPIIFQHHDSFMLETSEHTAQDWAAVLKLVMETAIEAFDGTDNNGVVFPVDIEIGKNWGVRSAENPEGLQAE